MTLTCLNFITHTHTDSSFHNFCFKKAVLVKHFAPYVYFKGICFYVFDSALCTYI